MQGTGGTRKTIERAQAMIREMLPHANEARRQPVSASEISLALQCGGSDAYSGITANPALGACADLLVRHGGTGDPVRDARDLRRRAPADPPRGLAARSARSWSSASTGGRSTARATAAR